MYVYYGTNEYNFETLPNPPEYEPALLEVRQGDPIGSWGLLPKGWRVHLYGLLPGGDSPIIYREALVRVLLADRDQVWLSENAGRGLFTPSRLTVASSDHRPFQRPFPAVICLCVNILAGPPNKACEPQTTRQPWGQTDEDVSRFPLLSLVEDRRQGDSDNRGRDPLRRRRDALDSVGLAISASRGDRALWMALLRAIPQDANRDHGHR